MSTSSKQKSVRLPESSKLLLAKDGSAGDPPRSANVYRIILYQLFDGIAYSLWNSTVQQQLIYTLAPAGDGNREVGYWAGISGVIQMTVAFAGGYLADKQFPRETICRFAVVCGCLAIGITALATAYSEVWIFYVSAVFWGAYGGLSNSAVEALFADSVPSGHRANIYTVKWIVQILSYLGGYIASIILFATSGNAWRVPTMADIMYVGLGIHIFAMLLLLTPSDRLALPKPPPDSASVSNPITTMSFAKNLTDADGQFASAHDPHDDDDDGDDPVAVIESGHLDNGSTLLSNATRDRPPNASIIGVRGVRIRPVVVLAHPVTNATFSRARAATKWGWLVPWLIAGGDLISALGAGMTVRYLQLFFVNDFGTTPVAWSIVTTISCVTTALAAQGVKMGAGFMKTRVFVLVVVRLLAAGMMFYLAEATGAAGSMYPMMSVYVIRMALSNAMLGMSRSVIMDFVPKEHRARWSAAESIGSFSWSGSALVGGFIADHSGYRATFIVTAVLQALAALVLIPAGVVEADVQKALIENGLVAA